MRKFPCAVFIVMAAMAVSEAQEPGALYMNPDLPAARRAADLISRMTPEEKVLQMQNSAPAIDRLGIPAYDWWNEALHGVARAGQATVFPQTVGLAATFDTPMMLRVAGAISTEARAKYHEAIRNNDHSRYHGLTFWSPNINIFRDPRWGRGQETYGEDPFLTGRMAVSFIRGLQGDDPKYFKVIATAKHYAVHSGPESTRHSFDVKPAENDLDSTYLPQFRAAITEGKADSVMCAYNRVDGIPACANTDLLQKHLRGEWGFQGYVVSDCGAITDIFRGHGYKTSAAEASAAAVKAGTDLTCGGEYRSLIEAVKNGLITQAEIDRSLTRLFEARFRLGMFDPQDRVPFSKIPYSVVDSDAHRKLALEAARKSIVLLKNENQTLPLSTRVKSIAVIGPAADDSDALLGNYNGLSAKLVTPLEGIERQFAGRAQVHYAPGANYTSQSMAPIPASVLTPPEGGGNGLLAEYFAEPSLQGAPKVRRVESRPVQHGLPDAAVAQAFPGGYTVRWTGTLRAPFSGEYVVGASSARTGQPQLRIYLDDKELTAPGGRGRGGRGASGQPHVQLEGGHSYRLRVECTVVRQTRVAGDVANTEMTWIPPAEGLRNEAIAAVRASDVAVAFIGLSPGLEGEEMPVAIPGFAGGDRTNLEIPEAQEKLLEAAVETGKPVVVVLSNGSALGANFAAQHAAAIVESWYGGEEIGTATAETLAGVNNPAGRIPVTFYKSVDQLPPFDDYSMKGRTYRYFAGDALYPFGYGLSYSKFAYSALRARRTGKGAAVSARVKNSSGVEGDEVVEVYVSGPGTPGGAIRQLCGFERIHLKPGESREVSFTLAPEYVSKGRTHVSVGGGQPLGATARVEGEF